MNLDTEVSLLRQVPMFAGVEPSRLKLLAFASERVRFAAHERVFRQGDPSDSAYVILEGAAEVTLDTAAGPLVVARLGRNAVLGEMGVLRDAPRSADVSAATEMVALRISRDVFFDLLREFPTMAISVMRDLAKRLDQTNARLAALSRR